MSTSLVRVYRAAAMTLSAVVLAAGAAACAAQPVDDVTSNDDQVFVQLREAARANNPARAAQLAAMIPNYPAPSYLEYFQIKPQLFDSSGKARIDAPDAPVLSFLQRYDGQAIADRMRNDYLLVLGARHDWRGFDEQYKRFVLDDDTQVKCYSLESRASRGENVADMARHLLVEPKNYGDACVDLISALAVNQQFSSDDVWTQARLAFEQNYTTTAGKIVDVLGPRPAGFDQAASAPPLFLARGVGSDAVSRQLALIAITRMARNDPDQAAGMMGTLTQLSKSEQAIAWGEIGMQAALKRSPMALQYYKQSGGAPLSVPGYEWRVRAALLAGDWPSVRWAIDQMPDELRAQPAWLYWHGRALKQAGDAGGANRDFEQVAGRFDFYGQLAAEELGQKTEIPPRTVVSDAEVDAMSQVPGFALARRFYALNLRLEGNREWNWPLRGMTDRQLLAAAEYAKRIDMLDRTVNTADRTTAMHDFTLRYPSPYRPIVERYAATNGLDIEWAYGLIRQESRFITNARSSVGAGGLMQLMPATAQLVAKKLGMGGISRAQMHDIDTNIQLGTWYLSDIYQKFDDSAVLATAGYNAGPGRPRQWRQALTEPVEGAIFAETIPFNETRDYVKNVLSNTTYYAALFEGKPQSLKARLGFVSP
ncbi:lytic transglycosylase domain-containing protein [Burkholderia gladioli]|uniref:lytic transglycosylase domain-containing protein n=1 Tax=Burkholderia gladioli TaxID=28095 RepID=UPI0005C2A162|nr:lytic transglycosylase domain-containing protein [Burkholderia gladioli]